MRQVNTSLFSNDECWGVQISGFDHCQNCKWLGISACEGQNIRKTGYNAKGYRIGEKGLHPENYQIEFDQSRVTP